MGTRITTLTVLGITAGVALGYGRESQGQNQPPNPVQIQPPAATPAPAPASLGSGSAPTSAAQLQGQTPARSASPSVAAAKSAAPGSGSNSGFAASPASANRPMLAAPASEYLRAAARLYNEGQYWKSSKYLRVAYDYQDKLSPDERVMLDVFIKALQQVPRELKETPPPDFSRSALAANSAANSMRRGAPTARPPANPANPNLAERIKTASASRTQDPNAGPASATSPSAAIPTPEAAGIFVPPLEPTPEAMSAAKKASATEEPKPAATAKPEAPGDAKPSDPDGSPAPGVVFEPLPAMQSPKGSASSGDPVAPNAAPAALAPDALGIIAPETKIPDPTADEKAKEEPAKSPASPNSPASEPKDKDKDLTKAGAEEDHPPIVPSPSLTPPASSTAANAPPSEADAANHFPAPELEEPRELTANGLTPPPGDDSTAPALADAAKTPPGPQDTANPPGAVFNPDSVRSNAASTATRSPRVDRNVAPTRISSIDMSAPRHQRDLGMLNPTLDANRNASAPNVATPNPAAPNAAIGEAMPGMPPMPGPNSANPGSFADAPPSFMTQQPIVPNFAPDLNNPQPTARRPVVDALKSFGGKVRDLISPEARRVNAMIAANAGKQALTYSPDNSILAGATGANGEITLWNTSTRQAIMTLPGSGGSRAAGPCLLLVFSPDGRQLIGVTAQGVIVHDLAARGRNRWELQTKASAIGFSPDGTVISINTMSGDTVYCKAVNGQVLGSLTSNFQIPPTSAPTQAPNMQPMSAPGLSPIPSLNPNAMPPR